MTTINVTTTQRTIRVTSTGQTITPQSSTGHVIQSALQGPTGPTGPQGAAQTDGLVIDVTGSPYNAVGDNLNASATANTTAIHAARTAAGVGGTLFFPDGTYYVTGLNASVASQRWILARNAVIKLQNSATSGNHTIRITADNVTIEGPGTVDGNKANQTLALDCVTVDSGADDATISGLTVQNAKGDGIRAWGTGATGCARIKVRDNIVTGCDGGNNAGIAFNWLITDSEIRGNHVTMPSIAKNGISVMNGSTDCRVVNNTVRGTTRFGIELWSDSASYPTDGCIRSIVANNIIGTGSEHGISVAGYSHHTTISGNTIEGSTQPAIEVAASHHCSVVGNTVRDSFAGIIANTSNFTSVTGNTVEGSSDNPITFQSCTRGGVCSGNVVEGWGSSKAGVRVVSSPYTNVTGNSFYKSAASGQAVGVEECASVVIANNDMIGGDYAVVLYQSSGTVNDILIEGNRASGQAWQKVRRFGTTVSRLEGNSWQYRTAVPAGNDSDWIVGDKIWRTDPSASNTPGWICTVAGDPGTWKAMANLQA